MAHGYPDWQPVSAGVGRDLRSTALAAVGDILPVPGAGLRYLLFWITISNAGVAGNVTIDEVTPGNVLVRQVFRSNPNQNETFSVPFDGAPLTAGNKLRVTAIPAGPVIFLVISGQIGA